MSGGMDIDWDARKRLEKKAEAKFGSLSKEQLDEKSEEVQAKIAGAEITRNMIDEIINGLREDIELLWEMYKKRKHI